MNLDPVDLVRGSEFWRDACLRMSANVCQLLRKAGQPVTMANIVRVVESLPRDKWELNDQAWRKHSYFVTCIQTCHGLADNKCADEFAEYFLGYFMQRSPLAKDTLVESFIGILRGIELDK